MQFFSWGQNSGNLFRILSLSFLFCFGLSHSAAPKDWKRIRFASEGARPPFNYLENNQLAGFEIDLANEICARLKATCEFVPDNWDDLIPHLLSGQYDAIIAAMDMTEERR